jgi:hypothetical protein
MFLTQPHIATGDVPVEEWRERLDLRIARE